MKLKADFRIPTPQNTPFLQTATNMNRHKSQALLQTQGIARYNYLVFKQPRGKGMASKQGFYWPKRQLKGHELIV